MTSHFDKFIHAFRRFIDRMASPPAGDRLTLKSNCVVKKAHCSSGATYGISIPYKDCNRFLECLKSQPGIQRAWIDRLSPYDVCCSVAQCYNGGNTEEELYRMSMKILEDDLQHIDDA